MLVNRLNSQCSIFLNDAMDDFENSLPIEIFGSGKMDNIRDDRTAFLNIIF
jgi:hypothetical protein